MDTKVIRRKLEEELRRIQDDLHALERVETLERALGNGRQVSTAPRHPAVPSPRPISQPFKSNTVIEACEEIAKRTEDRDWTVATMAEEVRRGGRPDASRENVGVSLRRLAAKGVLRIVAKSKQHGNVYKLVKTVKAAP